MRSKSQGLTAFFILICVLASSAVNATADTDPSARSADLFVSPGATGDCSIASPCGSINTALAQASSGDIVEMAAGTYGDQTVMNRQAMASFAQNVTVRSAEGGEVQLGRLNNYTPHVTYRNLRVTTLLYLRPGAHHSRLESIDARGATAYITAADNTAIVDSVIAPPPGQDGLQIKGLNGDNPVNTLIEGNTIGPAERVGTSHTDVIQLLGSENTILRNNILLPGPQMIMIGDGAGGTIESVLIERNFISHCPVLTAKCDAPNAVNGGGDNIRLLHNTIPRGGVALSTSNAGLVIAGNIIGSLKTCAGTVTNNLVASNGCGGALPVGNRPGVASFVNEQSHDLHLVPGSAGIDVGSANAGLDIDGESVCQQADLGADEVPCPDAGTVTTTTTAAPPTTTTQTPTTTTTSTTVTPTTPTRTTVVTPLPTSIDDYITTSHRHRAAATETAATETAATEPNEESFDGTVDSNTPFREFSFVTGGEDLTAQAVLALFAGVGSGQLKLTLSGEDGNVIATADGDTEAELTANLDPGLYRIRVAARPSAFSLTLTHGPR